MGAPIAGAVLMGFNVIDDDGTNRVNDLIAAVGKNITVISTMKLICCRKLEKHFF